MIKYQLRISHRQKSGRYDHKYSNLYDSVAELFVNPQFAKYVQKNCIGPFYTISVLTVTVADPKV